METLSAGTTTTLFKLPTTSSTARDLHHATAASNLTPHQHHYHLSSAPRRRSLTSSAFTPASALLLSTKPTSSSSSSPPPLLFHRRAASGYAAALLDAAQLGGPATLEGVARDVARFSRLMRREEMREFVGDATSMEVAGLMKSIVEKGRFHGQLKVVLELLIDKGRVGIWGEVLDEFHRIFRLLGHGFNGQKGVELNGSTM